MYINSLLIKSNSTYEFMDNSDNIMDTGRPKYTDCMYREKNTFGLDRTNNQKNWYHVANKLVTNDDTSINEISNKFCDKSVIVVNTSGKLIFDDIYKGILSSDPFEANEVKTQEVKTQEVKNPIKHTDDTYMDVYGNECTRSENDLEIKRYIRDYVLDGTTQCYRDDTKSKTEFTKKDIDEYREQGLQFHKKINGTSALPEDPVDRMNNITIAGGINATGQSIGDFYDNVVTGNVSNRTGPGFIMGSPVPIGRCVMPPTIDNKSGVPHGYYTRDGDAGKKYMMSDNWMYASENPNNGGDLFDNITASDPMIEYNTQINEE